jgi:methylase of polypeptide subunit release factors
VGKMINAADAAAKLGVSGQRIRALLAQRRIAGARLIGQRWFVPDDFTVKPGTRGPKPKSEQQE